MKMHFLSYCLIVAVIFTDGGNSDPAPTSGLGESKWTDIKKFRAMIEEDFPKEQSMIPPNNLLHRFLYENDYKLEQAKERLRQHLEWRKAENIDSILEENWTDMEERYPYSKSNITYIDSDKMILVVHIGQWNIRKVKKAERKRFVRYASAKIMEDMNNLTLSRTDPDGDEGRQSTKFDLVINLQGFYFMKHACLHCIGLLANTVEEVGTYWSQAVKQIFLANAPDLPEYALEWVEYFKNKFGIRVIDEQGEKIDGYMDDEFSTSVVVFREHVWVIREEEYW